ncbi:paraquat-inducible protein A [Undibacterium sp.]|jgi:paraquat-inducible protein A|uniref:paraquat-inducible protein A n=1 Tax=Undibacterium sp. TaxID=1914977 RepID=UPI002C76534B|nr:paraquat-inducible protein A [Undibacterium sp.]HTD02258.1 paraquat-inducible protein A [Undibacterium sp.]
MSSPTLPANKLIVCHECDLICQDAVLAVGESAGCPRCQATLYRSSRATLDQALAVAVTAAVLLLMLNGFPLLTLKVQQASRDTTLLHAALAMWDDGMHAISLLVVLTTMLAPALQIAIALYVLFALKFGDARRAIGAPMRWLQKIRPWSMVEVFMLGLLVSLVKLQNMADIVIGPALWSCAGMICVLAALASMLTPRNVWVWAHAPSAEINAAGAKHV